MQTHLGNLKYFDLTSHITLFQISAMTFFLLLLITLHNSARAPAYSTTISASITCSKWPLCHEIIFCGKISSQFF